ncbi:MAG TPA: caspase family protein [Aggregicoccus sp.]|nr:caspase family protein [Aggregicoccus sp.]
MTPPPLLPLLLVLLCATAPAAHAGSRRMAIVVGNNAGSGALPPLRYAEEDAAKLSRVLTELGDVASEDVFLLQGRGLGSLRSALAQARARAQRWQREPDVRAVLVFYFSGHSDGAALELGRDRVGYGDLRQWLEDTGAAVRVAIVDSCKSGALLSSKGGTPGPSFQIKLTDTLSSTGHALLTSSAADELALESREIGGSFFTHHLVSGLRGAADASGDGQVTLGEAYQYAFVHTVSATAETFIRGQHPAYHYELAGQGEFVLTRLSAHSATLALPQGFERALVTRPGGAVLAELPSGVQTRLALPPGAYTVRAWRGGRAHRGNLELRAGQERRVGWQELSPVPLHEGQTKGDLPGGGDGPEVVGVGLELRRAVLGRLPALKLVHVDLRGRELRGLSVGLALGRASARGLSESAAELAVGYRWGTRSGRLGARLGVEALVQYLHQSSSAGSLGWSLRPAAGPTAGAALQLDGALALEAGVRLPLTLLRRDGELVPLLQPGARVGLSWSFR